jgi:hypothetical protein
MEIFLHGTPRRGCSIIKPVRMTPERQSLLTLYKMLVKDTKSHTDALARFFVITRELSSFLPAHDSISVHGSNTTPS